MCVCVVGHKLTLDHLYKILHTCDKGLCLSMLEQLEIIKHSKNNQFKLLNEQINVSSSPLDDLTSKSSPLLRLFSGGTSSAEVVGANSANVSQRARNDLYIDSVSQ